MLPNYNINILNPTYEKANLLVRFFLFNYSFTFYQKVFFVLNMKTLVLQIYIE